MDFQRLVQTATLAARALIAHENSVEIKSTALDIAKKLKSDYDTLLKKHDLITDPFAMAQNMFTDDITKFPKVNIGQIFSYILSYIQLMAQDLLFGKGW